MPVNQILFSFNFVLSNWTLAPLRLTHARHNSSRSLYRKIQVNTLLRWTKISTMLHTFLNILQIPFRHSFNMHRHHTDYMMFFLQSQQRLKQILVSLHGSFSSIQLYCKPSLLHNISNTEILQYCLNPVLFWSSLHMDLAAHSIAPQTGRDVATTVCSNMVCYKCDTFLTKD